LIILIALMDPLYYYLHKYFIVISNLFVLVLTHALTHARTHARTHERLYVMIFFGLDT
jgi:hypothetical protein